MKRQGKNLVWMTAVLMMSAQALTGCGAAEKNETQSVEVVQTTASSVVAQESNSGGTESDTTGTVAESSQESTIPVTTQTTAEGSRETTTTPELDNESQAEFNFVDLSGWEFLFGSGVGAWGTTLRVEADGSFTGQYHDSDMGSNGDTYPNGTVYLCDFTGSFTEPERVNDYTYLVRIDNITLAEEPEREEITEGTRYIYSEPYGMEDAEEIWIYLPGAPIAELPEGYRSWVGYYNLDNAPDTGLPFYGLYNVNPQNGFSSSESSEVHAEGASIDDELAEIEAKEADLENKLQKEAVTQLDMNMISNDIFYLWDEELNSIWVRLKEKLDGDTMEALLTEQLAWIEEKKAAVQAAGAEYEGGSIQPLIMNNKAAELTKERVYELAEYLR